MGIYRGQNFSPFNNYTIAATTTSANQVVVQPVAPLPQCTDITVSNNTSAVAYVAWNYVSGTPVTASATAPISYPILAGQTQVINVGGSVQNVAVILSTGSGNVYVSIGTGT